MTTHQDNRGASYQGQRLDGPVAEFHRAVNRLRRDSVPAALSHQRPSPPTPPHRHDPSQGQAQLLEEAS